MSQRKQAEAKTRNHPDCQAQAYTRASEAWFIDKMED